MKDLEELRKRKSLLIEELEQINSKLTEIGNSIKAGDIFYNIYDEYIRVIDIEDGYATVLSYSSKCEYISIDKHFAVSAITSEYTKVRSDNGVLTNLINKFKLYDK